MKTKYVAVLLLASSSFWVVDAMAWNCTQRCPSAVLSGKFECKLYQKSPMCVEERRRAAEPAPPPQPASNPEAPPPPQKGKLSIQVGGNANGGDYNPEDAVKLPSGDSRIRSGGLGLASGVAISTVSKAAAPEYKERELTVETEVGGPQPYFKPMPEGMDQGEVIAWNGKYKIKYKNGDRPVVTFPGYIDDSYTITNIDKITIKELKTERWLLSIYHDNNALPLNQVLKKLPAPVQNINQQKLLEDSQIEL